MSAPTNTFGLNNVRIQAKLIAGFAVVLALLLGIGGISYWQFTATSHQVDAYGEQVEIASAAARVETAFLRLQAYAREFANIGLEEDAEAVRRLAPGLDARVEEALAIAEAPEFRHRLEEIAAAVDAYMDDFHEAERLQADLHGLIEETLDVDGARLIEDLHEMQRLAEEENNGDAAALSAVAREHTLAMQLFTHMLLSEGDERHAESARREFRLMEQTLAALSATLHTSEERRIFAELEALLAEYEAGFDRVLEDRHALYELSHTHMVAAAEVIETDTEWLQATAVAAETEIRERTESGIANTEALITVLVVLSIGLGSAIAWLIGRAISRPVINMTRTMECLARGDTAAAVPATDQRDEIGEMARAVQIFRDSMIKTEEMRQSAAKEQETKALRAERLERMTAEFDEQVGGVLEAVNKAVHQMRGTADALAVTAGEASTRATTVAAAAEEASTNVQTVASAAEELGSSIDEISRQVQLQTTLASQASEAAEQSRAQIQGLAAHAQSIGDVVELITGIAEQTNLLALNATIEAARAGDAGKGFAVVASEVKSLANQTASATDKIAGQIQAVQDQTSSTVQAIEAINEKIASVNEISSTVAAAVAEQNAAAQEIGRNVGEAAQGTQEVSSNIAGVNQVAGETGTASTEVLSVTTELGSRAEALDRLLHAFLKEVRAA